MSKPIVAIVGRPNVGKSTLFNYIGQKRVSIVEDIPGVTRDRVYLDAQWLDREFTMIDTGGIELESTHNIVTDIFIANLKEFNNGLKIDTRRLLEAYMSRGHSNG